MQLPVLRPETPPERRRLANGSVLLLRPLPEVYGVAVGVVVRTGTRDEADDEGGISHLLEHMVFKGTATRSALELARDMESIGGQLDAYTTKEHTAYTLKVLPPQLEPALAILADMLERSTFPEDQLELEKQVVVEEILSADDSPDDYVHERFNEHLWPAHPLRRPILGTEESVRAIDRATLVRFADRVHRGTNLVVSAAGAIGAAEAERIERAFGFLPGGPDGARAIAADPAPGVHVHRKKSLSQQYVEIGIPTVDVAHPDRFAISLLSNLLGGGMSSRLFQKVREEEALAYSIYNYTDFHRDTGLLATSFSASRENCQRALDLIAAEYRRLREGDLEETELESNRAQLVSSVVLGMETTTSQMLRAARTEIAYGRFVTVAEILDQIGSVTREDVVRVAEQYLDPTRQTVVGYGPLAELAWPAA